MVEDQCPKRGPGLSHRYRDNICEMCGIARYWAWWQSMLAGLKSQPARIPVPPTPEEQGRSLGEFAALSAREWHALVVERRHWERHPSAKDRP